MKKDKNFRIRNVRRVETLMTRSFRSINRGDINAGKIFETETGQLRVDAHEHKPRCSRTGLKMLTNGRSFVLTNGASCSCFFWNGKPGLCGQVSFNPILRNGLNFLF